jgi:hypothetical protein
VLKFAKKHVLGFDFFSFCGALQEGFLPVVGLETLHAKHMAGS